jgi:histidine triad (HIT) family protein
VQVRGDGPPIVLVQWFRADTLAHDSPIVPGFIAHGFRRALTAHADRWRPWRCYASAILATHEHRGGPMIRHAPDGYRCPICALLRGRRIDAFIDGGHVVWGAEHVLRADDDVAIVMNVMWWGRNEGSVIVVPREHYENVYDLPVELGFPLQRAVHDTAIAMRRSYGCAGVSTRQHNEPAGDQEVWHYHVHVVPRFENDGLYAADFAVADPEVVLRYATLLAGTLDVWPKGKSAHTRNDARP